ncbi:MAG: ribonuclease PH, partial [Armatimonadetes bacterium]|nr:ribonuclease PH [Armatimonadota bacterium]
MRADGRQNNEIRPCAIERRFIEYAEGSALIRMGNTHVLCTATVTDKLPRWLAGGDQGWITAEYSLLPRATIERTPRETTATSGRTFEIQRMIGRALRAVCDLRALAPWCIIVDCDVLQADGGTRTAAITGGYVAVAEAISWMIQRNLIRVWPLTAQVAAISAGLVQGEVLVDLTYEEDRMAAVDLNLVLTETGRIVEVQAAAEGNPFTSDQLNALLQAAAKGIKDLLVVQK